MTRVVVLCALLVAATSSFSLASLFGSPVACDGDVACPFDRVCRNSVCVIVGEGEGAPTAVSLLRAHRDAESS